MSTPNSLAASPPSSRNPPCSCNKKRKINEESPNILDLLKNREVDLLINTPTKANDAQRDGFKIRRTAIEYGVEVLTSIDTLNAIIKVQELNVDKMDLDIFDIAQI